MNIAILVSGNGSNLQALIDFGLSGKIVGVLSNQANAYALERAKQANIATAVISHKDFLNRESFDEQIHQQLLAWNVDLVVLAGFMRILSATFVEQWSGKMVNIHPSLLPAYKGMHTHRRVLHSGDTLHGCTVHFVTPELDSGQAIAQGILQVKPHDDENTLAQRVHQIEHFIYPQVVEWICTQQVNYQTFHNDTAQVYYRQKPLLKPILFYQDE